MTLDRKKVTEMTEEELKAFAESDDNHLYISLDDASIADDLDSQEDWLYHDEDNCLACYARTVLNWRETEQESKKPGNLPAVYIPGKQSVMYKNIPIKELLPGDFAAYCPNPGNRKIKYMECVDTVYDEERNNYLTVWRLTNSDIINPHFAWYETRDNLDIYRIFPLSGN